MRQTLLPYIDLLSAFVEEKIQANDFEKSYLKLIKSPHPKFDEQEYEILNNLFYSVEDYCSDPALRDETTIDDEQLLQDAKNALQALKELE